ncbi:hypothetical protein [Ideonella sp. YS5]|uniref:hypothetical protein n=1 Tax=Ideonella sp. YS5 TaxID=3453714 RepID=UPI003EE93707
MTRLSIRLLSLAASVCLIGAASAQTAAPAKPAAPAAKPAAKKAAPAKPAPKPVVEETLPAASSEQASAAQMTHIGHYDCEFNQGVEVAMNPKYDGYVDVTFGKQKYTMKPVLSSTGALRLEDVKGQTLMLQIAYKSMLMDVKAGRRLVDECVSEKQRLAKKAAEGQPSAGLMSDGAAASTSR